MGLRRTADRGGACTRRVVMMVRELHYQHLAADEADANVMTDIVGDLIAPTVE